MLRSSRRVWGAGLAPALFACVLSGGCSGMVNMLAIPALFTGSETIEPKVKLLKDRHATAKVLVLSYANSDLRWGNDLVDEELTAKLGAELAKNDRIKLVPERKIRAWRDLHPRWENKPLQSIGEEFDVDFVVFLEVTDFAVSNPKSPYLLQGKAKVNFKVHDVKKDRQAFSETYSRDFPANRPVPASDVPSNEAFRDGFVYAMARELSWNLVPRSVTETIQDPW